jgi:3'(2'), 5'-bisphosphate nucleotidase
VTQLQALLTTMLDAAIAASAVINEVYARPIVAEHKSDGSPVTEADSMAEAVILSYLDDTGIPVLAEESVAAGRIPELGRRFFVVDPLDGTKEFIKRNGEFTVNIALVEDGKAVLGVVLAPVTGQAFTGGPEGAFRMTIIDGQPTGKRPISVERSGPIRIVASRSHGHAALAALCEELDIAEDVSVGSSLKFCLLAQGDAQLYPRFTPTCEWDTAAGQAVLEAAGGVVLTLDGEPLAYGNQQRDFLNPFFVAAADRELGRKAAARMAALIDDNQGGKNTARI